MKKIKPLLAIVFATMLGACSPKNLAYFQDISQQTTTEMKEAAIIKIQPADELSIIVKSKDALLADLFNMPIVSHRVGYGESSGSSPSQYVASYVVDSQGRINFPTLGQLELGGKTREEAKKYIEDELKKRNLVNDPVVVIYYMNTTYTVLGEVARPGRYAFSKDKISILDAIGQCGDLTINGVREKVLVMRTDEEKQTTYTVDLTNYKELVNSPVYYLQQNDVIYVTPNEKRMRESTVNGNNILSTSFWISVASLVASVASIIINSVK